MMNHSNLFPEGKMTFENGILYLEYNRGTIVDMNVLYRQIIYRQSLTKENDFYMIVDFRNNIDVTEEATAFMVTHPNPEHIKGLAMLTKYGVDYTRAKLYSVFDGPNVKTKAVLSIEEAHSWFESMEKPILRKAS
jgi:hypothetical protein